MNGDYYTIMLFVNTTTKVSGGNRTLDQTLGSGPAIDLQKMPILAKKITFSDEAHFDFGGYVNKQNCSIWGTENSNSKRVTVWCGLWSRGIIGPFFFEKEHVERIFVHKYWRGGYCNIWFQQDGATCHTAKAILDVLRTVFEDRIISRKADVVWSPRSCDLTRLNYYLWCAVKDKCYEQARDNWRFKGQYSWSHCWNIAAHNR